MLQSLVSGKGSLLYLGPSADLSRRQGELCSLAGSRNVHPRLPLQLRLPTAMLNVVADGQYVAHEIVRILAFSLPDLHRPVYISDFVGY